MIKVHSGLLVNKQLFQVAILNHWSKCQKVNYAIFGVNNIV